MQMDVRLDSTKSLVVPSIDAGGMTEVGNWMEWWNGTIFDVHLPHEDGTSVY